MCTPKHAHPMYRFRVRVSARLKAKFTRSITFKGRGLFPDFDFDAESSFISDPDSVTVLSALPSALSSGTAITASGTAKHCQCITASAQ